MNRYLCVAVCCVLSFVVTSGFAAPVLDHPLPGGYFNAEYFAGTGVNTAYFVVDFGGSGGGIHGFGYHWDGTQTADNALLAIDIAGSLDVTYTDFGSPGQPNLFLSRLTDLLDTDLPDFGIDGRFWDYFLGSYNASNVGWTESNYGISGRDFATGNVVQTLTNGGFYGFYASANGTQPTLPIAVPEPTSILLVAVGLMMIAGKHRRKTPNFPRRFPTTQFFAYDE